jgi:predicted transcriptional regulator
METLNTTECKNTIPAHVETLLNNLKTKNSIDSESGQQESSPTSLPIKYVPEPIPTVMAITSTGNSNSKTQNLQTLQTLASTKLGQEVIAEMETKKISNLLKDFIEKNNLTPQEVNNLYTMLGRVKNSLPAENNVYMSWSNDKLKVQVSESSSNNTDKSEVESLYIKNSNVNKTMWGLSIFAVILVLMVVIFIVMK